MESSRDTELENSSDDDEVVAERTIHLTETISMFPHQKLSKHRKVVAGEIRSPLQSRPRSCVIKFDDTQITNEIKALSRLSNSHSNVIYLIHTGTYNDTFCDVAFIVMEQCHPLNLEQYVLSETFSPVYDVRQGLKYCEQIIEGMKHIHENLIIHKDLKPSNIFLTHDLANVKIADFGSSQEIETSSSMVPCTSIFGTLGYRPPESLNMSHVSLKSDTFSLGTVFYFLLSEGHSPFGAESDKWDHNTQNGVIGFSQLLVSNPMVTRHLLEAMLNMERCRRPSIEHVGRHPCWREAEGDLRFEYPFEVETDDAPSQQPPEPPSPPEPDEFMQALRILMNGIYLREPPEWSMADGRYAEAAETLRLMYDLRGFNKLKISLQLVECHVRLKTDRVQDSIQRVKISIPRSYTVDDVLRLSRHNAESGHFIRSLILFRIANETRHNATPNDDTIWIADLVYDVVGVTRKMIISGRASRDIGVEYGLTYMEELLGDVRAMEGVSDDVRVVNMARCLVDISCALNDDNKHQQAISRAQEGVTNLERQFGERTGEYTCYGALLHNIAVSHDFLGEYSDAVRFYIKALAACEKADFETVRKKVDYLKIITNHLRLALTELEL